MLTKIYAGTVVACDKDAKNTWTIYAADDKHFILENGLKRRYIGRTTFIREWRIISIEDIDRSRFVEVDLPKRSRKLDADFFHCKVDKTPTFTDEHSVTGTIMVMDEIDVAGIRCGDTCRYQIEDDSHLVECSRYNKPLRGFGGARFLRCRMCLEAELRFKESNYGPLC